MLPLTQEQKNNAIDGLLNILSAGSAAIFWQGAYDLMYNELEKEYFGDLPPIDQPGQYFGNGYYWATNMILGVAGGIGSLLPYAFAGCDIRQHARQLRYLAINSLLPDTLWQTFYDLAWYIATHSLESDDVKYPTDSTQHALVCLSVFMPLVLLTHFGYNSWLDRKNAKYGWGTSVVYAMGAAGFMIGTRKIDKAHNYEALPTASLHAFLGAVVGESIRQGFFNGDTILSQLSCANYLRSLCPNFLTKNNQYEAIPEQDNQPASKQSYAGYLWSMCGNPFGGKSTQQTTAVEHELDNVEAQKNCCTCCQ